MLETDLDIIIKGPTTFVAARYSGTLDNCLWVGLIAASPGHPVIARSIENIIHSLLLGTHADRVALERDLMGNCENPYVADLWKFRSPSADNVFKDCSLGIAYNQILGKTSKSPTSHIGFTAEKGGTSRILLIADNDAGATRLTDLSMNLLVASIQDSSILAMSVQDRSIQKSWAQRKSLQETVA
jgi:hypothetical protein